MVTKNIFDSPIMMIFNQSGYKNNTLQQITIYIQIFYA